MESEKSITAEDFHLLVLDFANEFQKRHYKAFKNHPQDIVRGALFTIFHDAVIIHRSVGELVFGGWSSSAAILVRTLIDLTVSMAAILNSQNSPLAAFRYFNSSYRQISRDENFNPEFRRGVRGLIREQIGLLPKEDRPAALQFLKEKDRAYWFWEEWKSPSEVIKNFGSSKLLDAYKGFSAATHGGFFGLRIYRDQFDIADINPRFPIGKQAVLVSASSSRYLIELISLRSRHANLDGVENICVELREKIETIEVLRKNGLEE